MLLLTLLLMIFSCGDHAGEDLQRKLPGKVSSQLLFEIDVYDYYFLSIRS